MVCFTDFRFEFNSYSDLINSDHYKDNPTYSKTTSIEFIFMSDSDLYKFVGFLVSNGLDSSELRDITPMLDDLRCKDIEDHSAGCYVMLDFTPENFDRYRLAIHKFSRRFNMAACGDY